MQGQRSGKVLCAMSKINPMIFLQLLGFCRKNFQVENYLLPSLDVGFEIALWHSSCLHAKVGRCSVEIHDWLLSCAMVVYGMIRALLHHVYATPLHPFLKQCRVVGEQLSLDTLLWERIMCIYTSRSKFHFKIYKYT